jgi:DNA-3-methyladenine glycosylase
MSGNTPSPFSIACAPVLPPAFFARDTVTVARELLGRVLVSTAGGVTTSGRIVETEAYLGAEDPGSHAATKGVTKRNAVMYGAPGHAYVYFTYGNHHMLNIVTEADGVAGAVLIRAIEPIEGLEEMERRRASSRRGDVPLPVRDVANGPGKLAAALGIDLGNNGEPLDGSATLSVLASPDAGGRISASGRIGLSSGHEAELRFYLEGNRFVSRARPGLRPTPRSHKGGRER